MTDRRNAVLTSILIGGFAILLYALRPAFFWRDDFQAQYLPGSFEVAKAWLSGTLPLLTRATWFSSALAGEYQYGVFSIFRALLDVTIWTIPLSLTARAAALFIVHAMIAAAGAFVLARSYGVRSSLAAMVALVASLNGTQLWWGTTWFPTMASFAWLPWYWLALRGIVAGRRWSWLGAALSLYLLITAGWHYGTAMAIVVAAMQFAQAVIAKRWRAALIMTAASALGLALAMPAVLMLLEYFRMTTRHAVISKIDPRFIVPPAGFFGLILPVFAAPWTVFIGTVPHPAVELLGGFIPLAGLACARRRFWREHWSETLALLGLIVLMLLPGVGTFRWSFRWLPLFHLLLALLGARAMEDDKRAPKFALLLIAIAVLGSFAFDADRNTTLIFAAILAIACALWPFMRRVAPIAITMLSIAVTLMMQSTRTEVPAWTIDDSILHAKPFDPARRYLALYEPTDIYAPDAYGRYTRGINAGLRPSNLPMFAGLHFINGYTPLGPEAMHDIFSFDIHGCVVPVMGRWLVHSQSAPMGLLHHFGVDGLVVPTRVAQSEQAALAKNGWIAQGQVANATIYHRARALPSPVFAAASAFALPNARALYDVLERHLDGPLPLLLLGEPGKRRYGFRQLDDVRDERLRVEVLLRGTNGPALIVFRRPWLPGWRATLNGKPLEVIRADAVMPAVEIPNGAQGKLELVYRPASLIIGGWVALASLFVIAATSLWLRLKT